MRIPEGFVPMPSVTGLMYNGVSHKQPFAKSILPLGEHWELLKTRAAVFRVTDVPFHHNLRREGKKMSKA